VVSGALPYSRPVSSDFDEDGDVDGQDFLTFTTCFNEAWQPPRPGCLDPSADLDADGDVDVRDFLTFSNCMNGSLKPPKQQCGSPIPLFDVGTVAIDLKSSGQDDLKYPLGSVPATIPVEVYVGATTSGPSGLNNGLQGLYVDIAGSALAGVMQSALTLDSTFTAYYMPMYGMYGLGFDQIPSNGTPTTGAIGVVGAIQTQPPGPVVPGDMPGAATVYAPVPTGLPPVQIATGTLNLASFSSIGTYGINTNSGANLWLMSGDSTPAYMQNDVFVVTVCNPACDADLDADGDVDGNDFITFSLCYNGSINPPQPGCPTIEADLDDDGDVDGFDFTTFSVCFNNSLNPPSDGCLCCPP
jgi:hypothetical protein